MGSSTSCYRDGFTDILFTCTLAASFTFSLQLPDDRSVSSSRPISCSVSSTYFILFHFILYVQDHRRRNYKVWRQSNLWNKKEIKEISVIWADPQNFWLNVPVQLRQSRLFHIVRWSRPIERELNTHPIFQPQVIFALFQHVSPAKDEIVLKRPVTDAGFRCTLSSARN
jgi:hypothetical protein